MFYIHKHLLFYVFFYISVDCLIPNLNVQKLDRKFIEQNRQDTLDMCRMFAEENNRLDRLKMKKNRAIKHNFLENPRRVKRDLNPVNSSLDYVEARRVETIVDKLYDDMAEHGERVLYRRRKLSTNKAPVTRHKQSGRRFKFAPAVLLPPSPNGSQLITTDESSYEIPWPKNWNHGIVPYFIDPNTYDTQLSDIIIRAFDYFERATCIRLQRLRERPTDKESLQNVEWVYITNPSGIRQCVHSNERKANRGVQMVVFGYDCMSLGEILHEVMHILGFSHEHTRPDRDQYITVLWDNIKPGYKKYFEIRTDDPLSSLPYDYSSVLHYPSRAFSQNGQVTILVEPGLKIGQREGLSDTDVAKVTTIYSPKCVKRNKEYLLNTCPSAVKINRQHIKNITQNDIENYFEDRLWPFGIVNYKIKDKMEFSTEERENLDAVIRHIEKETCIEFRDISKNIADVDEDENNNNDNDDKHLHLQLGKGVDVDSSENVTKNNRNPSSFTSPYPEKNETINVMDYIKFDFIKENITNATSPKEENETIYYVHKDAFKDDAEEDAKEKEVDIQENLIDSRKNFGSNTGNTKNLKYRKKASRSSYAFGSLSKASNHQKKQIRRKASTASRRHAESTLNLVRSSEPGCRCTPPGKPTGDQVLKINADCFNSVNDLLHLFVHILGLDHQHNMHDRDSFLHIIWDNLTPEIKKEMQKKLPPAAAVGFPYDYQSVMHYPWLQIKNGVTNIMYPIWNDGWAMGHWQGLSSTDVNKLNLIYYEQCSLRRQHAQE